MNQATRKTIEKFAREGAALTLFFDDGWSPTFVIASEILLMPRALIFYDIGQAFTGGVHRVRFDVAKLIHSLGVEFRREGKWIGYLCPLSEDSDENRVRWSQWQEWLRDPVNREHYDACIASELADLKHG